MASFTGPRISGAKVPQCLNPNDPKAAMRVQAVGTRKTLYMATTDMTPPTSWEGCLEYMPGFGFDADKSLAALFPGIITSTGYVWQLSEEQAVSSVSYA